MRPIHNPKMKDIKVGAILHALANRVRVQIFMEISEGDCSQSCSNFLQVKNKKMPKSTLSNHFRILREAGLIKSEKKGLELHNTSRCKELKAKFGGLIIKILEAYKEQEK